MNEQERESRASGEVWPGSDFEVRADRTGMTFHGYAALFNVESEPLPFRETIMPGAFSRSLATPGNNIRMFLNHNTNVLLATTRAGTLRLAEDDKGLRVEADLPDTTAGRDLATLIERRDVDSMSFTFKKVSDSWADNGMRRTIKEVRLFEVSPLTEWPAYPGTSAFVRSLATLTDADTEPIELALRALVDPAGQLTAEQRDLLITAINKRTEAPAVVGARLAEWQRRFATRLS